MDEICLSFFKLYMLYFKKANYVEMHAAQHIVFCTT